MDCRAYCNAASYQIKPLFEMLKETHTPTLYRDVIHIHISAAGYSGDVFYFSYGAMVTWGLPLEIDIYYLERVKQFEPHPIDETDKDEFTFTIGDHAKIVEDEIFLPQDDVLNRLAVSHGLAQSVKLGTFEAALHKVFKSSKQIPEDLAKYGRIALSRKEIRRKMGDLFIKRSSINLHSNVLDTPEFFWEYSELEPLYTMTANYLDIKNRVYVLNDRLTVVHELFEMLGNELNHQHSSRLEWTIIILIIIEVVMTLLRDVFRIL